MTKRQAHILRKLRDGYLLRRRDYGTQYDLCDQRGQELKGETAIRNETIFIMQQQGLLEIGNYETRRGYVPTAFALAALEDMPRRERS